jgi:hypothetical protein
MGNTNEMGNTENGVLYLTPANRGELVVHPATQVASFRVGRITMSLYRISALTFLVFFLLGALLAIQPLLTDKSSSDKYEQLIPMAIASLENEPNSTKDFVGKVSDFDAILSDSVGFQDKYQGRTQDEPVLVDVWPQHQFRQESLPRPPPKK